MKMNEKNYILSLIRLSSCILVFSMLILWSNHGKLHANENIFVSSFLSDQVGAILIKGNVVDAESTPIPGVTILEKGTSNGTVTDENGNFQINLSAKNNTLIFSSIGMKTQEIQVEGRNFLSVIMEEDVILLDEVVSVGYGTQKKINLTGAVSAVSGDDLDLGIGNLSESLQGIIPNLNVSMESGAPGLSADLNIRGFTSINGGSPLVLVDGIPQDMANVDPNNVASVSVLKDASSAAIYGARGAFGVILITTKTGVAGKPTVFFSGLYAILEPTRRLESMNSIEYMEFRNQGYMRINGRPYYSEGMQEAIVNHFNDPENYAPVWLSQNGNYYNGVANTNWVDELWKKRYPMQNYFLSISGGNKTAGLQYYTSLAYNNQKGLPKHFDEYYNRYILTSRLTYTLGNWLQASINLQLTQANKHYPGDTNNSRHSETDFPFWINSFPTSPVYLPDGRYYQSGSVPNIVAFHKGGSYRERDETTVMVTGGIEMKPLKDLSLNMDYSIRLYDQENISFWRSLVGASRLPGYGDTYYPFTTPSRVYRGNSDNRNITVNVFSEYSKTFNKKNNFKAILGFNQEYAKYTGFNAYRERLIVEDIPFMSLADGLSNVTDYASEYALRGVFGRLNYDYDGRYLLELNGRYDGSSRFPENDRFALFPSFSIGWRIDNELFIKDIKQALKLNMLKVRYSYGNLGNQVVGSYYPYISTYSTGNTTYILDPGQNLKTVWIGDLVSPSLTWETINQHNLGIDYAQFNNKVQLTFDVYQRNTFNMLTKSEPLPAVLGGTEPKTNAADLRTTGFDLSVILREKIRKVDSKLTLTLSDNYSKITKYENPEGVISDYYVGHNFGDIWGFVTEGLFETDEEAEAWDQSQIVARTLMAGDIKFVDLDGDGKVTRGSGTLSDPGDQKIIGNNTPRYSFGVKTELSWNGFDFELFFQGVMKRDTWLAPEFFLTHYTNEWSMYPKVATDWWTEDNRGAYFPRPIVGQGQEMIIPQTRFLQNSAYLRLKNTTLGYTLNKRMTNKLHLNRLRVYFTGRNLWEATKMVKIADPELAAVSKYPLHRQYSLGIQITF